MSKLEKVKVKDDGKRGFKSINKSDYNEELHELYKEELTKKEALQNEAELLGIEGFDSMTIAKLEEAIEAEKAD